MNTTLKTKPVAKTVVKASPKKVQLVTMGCQMNKLDSELVMGQMLGMGYTFTDNTDEAGVVIFNTCSVRENAENKAMGRVHNLKKRHKEKKDLILVVMGCMAQRNGRSIQKDHSHIDIACGPGQIHKIGEQVQEVQHARGINKNKQVLLMNSMGDIEKLEELDTSRQFIDRATPLSAYVRVIRGCNKFCHYCVVPFTRGKEVSRPINNIVDETKMLIDSGAKEITLLGQTVNSYKYTQDGKTYGLGDIFEKIHDIAGLERIRFVTNYPHDSSIASGQYNESIMYAMRDLPKVCEFLHMPVQSGSDRILKEMNRHYTAQGYVDLIDRFRDVVPNLFVAGDIIVGYCTETEEDFQKTIDVLGRVRFKNNFIYQYSQRPKTEADKLRPDDVPRAVKKERNNRLLEVQNRISLEDNQKLIGTVMEVMVEGPSKKPHLAGTNQPPVTKSALYLPDNKAEISKTNKLPLLNQTTADACGLGPTTDPQLVGRTRGDHIAVFNGPENLVGQVIKVKVVGTTCVTLFTEIVK